jgi:hypothetical protein
MSPLPTPLARICLVARTCLVAGAAIVVGAAILIVSTPDHARAGIGNPLKKAKEKLAKAAAPKEEDEGEIDNDTIIFDDVTLELTEARVASMVTTLKATKAARAEREAAVGRLNKASEALNAHDEKHGEGIRALQEKRGEFEVCYNDGYHAARERKMQEYSQRALSDPVLLKKFQQAAAENNAAAAKGDSAAINRLNAIMAAEILPSHEDSVEVRRKCGPLPPPSPAEIKFAALEKDVAARTEELRDIDKKAGDAQASASNMDSQQYAMALERVHAFVAWADSKSKTNNTPRGFTPEEIAALEKQLAELRDGIRN